MKSVLIETASNEELKMVEDFIKEHKLRGYIVGENKATDIDFFNDVIRMLIPIV